ncbi:hypothetical protein [Brevundimonas sp. GCM10030266]|uniref:hypothetical protein n=1 Tax=Brevundimonas sp. GCM10030266 TaxID=3273386 RepID=UPI0036078543
MFAELAFAVALIQQSPPQSYSAGPHTWTAVHTAGQLPWKTPPGIQYPDQARDRDIYRGDVTIGCEVRLDTGRLENCRVLAETPEGVGFGRRAVVGLGQSYLDTTRWSEPLVAVRVGFVGNF